MDLHATRRVMHAVCEALPSWLNWRAETLQQQAEFIGAPVTDAARRMTELWQRALADVAEADALRAVQRLAQLAEKPTYGDLPNWIRGEAARRAPAVQPQLRYDEHGPRYRCLDCRDTGWSICVNAAFVRAFRERFLAMGEADFAGDERGSWWRHAELWWREIGGRDPLEAAYVCRCEAGDRKPQELPRRNPQTMPVAGPPIDRRGALAQWYATHAADEVEYWEVPQFAGADA